ncbi:MAG: hypothetical protein ACR2OU_02315, partial [Thermomicrobiales bacterium]
HLHAAPVRVRTSPAIRKEGIMDYTAKTLSELRTIRLRFQAALQNPRLNATNHSNIERWLGEVETQMCKAAPVATPAVVTAPVPSIRDMRNGTAAPRNAADQNRLQWSYLS